MVRCSVQEVCCDLIPVLGLSASGIQNTGKAARIAVGLGGGVRDGDMNTSCRIW